MATELRSAAKICDKCTDGAWMPDDNELRETAELVEIAERSAGNVTLGSARYVRGLTLLTCGGSRREEGIASITAAREAVVHERFTRVIIGFPVPTWAAEMP
ncbi:hypothetical protein ACX9NE_01805 [Mycobacterium sp. ML4]